MSKSHHVLIYFLNVRSKFSLLIEELKQTALARPKYWNRQRLQLSSFTTFRTLSFQLKLSALILLLQIRSTPSAFPNVGSGIPMDPWAWAFQKMPGSSTGVC